MFENKQKHHYNEELQTHKDRHIHELTDCGKLHRSKSDWILALRRRSRHKLIYLTKKLSPIYNCSQRNLVFSNGVSPGIQTTLKNRPHAKQQMSIPNKYNGIFQRFFFFSYYFVWDFSFSFSPYQRFACVLWSPILCFYFVCVYVSLYQFLKIFFFFCQFVLFYNRLFTIYLPLYFLKRDKL